LLLLHATDLVAAPGPAAGVEQLATLPAELFCCLVWALPVLGWLQRVVLMVGCELTLLAGRDDAVLLLLLLLVVVVLLLVTWAPVLLAGMLVALLLPTLLLLPPRMTAPQHPCNASSSTSSAASAAAVAATASAAAGFRPRACSVRVPAAVAWLLRIKLWLLISAVLLATDALLLGCRCCTCRLSLLLPGVTCCRSFAGCCCCCSCRCSGCDTCLVAVAAAKAPLSAVLASAAAATTNAAAALTAAMSRRNKRVSTLKINNTAASTAWNLPPMAQMLRGISTMITA
jgi:hypothetical protein